MIQSLQTSHPSRISIDAPELLDIQRQGFYKFIKEGVIKEFSKISPIKLETGKNNLQLILDATRYKFISPEDTPRECILKMKTYGCQIYIEAKLVCQRTADKKIIHDQTEWILVGNLPMMTKRGHFIINGSPRVVVHQVIRTPGIYFQQIVEKTQGKETRFYGDIIPRRGVWLRLQINKYGNVDIRLKNSKKVKAELLQRCLGVIEKQSQRSPTTYKRVSTSKSGSESDLVEAQHVLPYQTKKSVSEHYAFCRIYNQLYRPLEDKEREEAQAPRGQKEYFADYPIKRERCYKNLFETFKVTTRYNLGEIGREKLNEKFGLDIKEQQLTSFDIKAAIAWLQDLQKGYKTIDDIDHSQNRRIISSGELLQNQFENGVDRLKKLIWVKLKDLGTVLDGLDFERSQSSVMLPTTSGGQSKLNKNVESHFISISSHPEASSGSSAEVAVNLEQSLTNLHKVKLHPSSLNITKRKGSKPPLSSTKQARSTDLERKERNKAFSHRAGMSVKNERQIEINLKDLITTKPINGALREFFGSNPLSQYMDQTNPLAELTHKRRISSLGLGGVSRESAGMAIRGIHPTHYGRICPIETPEGKNAGLVNSLAFYAKVNDKGFLETPYFKVVTGQVQQELGFSYFSAKDEDDKRLYIAPSDLYQSRNNVLGKEGAEEKQRFAEGDGEEQFIHLSSQIHQICETNARSADSSSQELKCIRRQSNDSNSETKHVVPVRVADNFVDVFQKVRPDDVDCIAISPIQMISVATSLIPFLEHNDANRALMGSNMQRQAVPLMIAERPLVGTGLEALVVAESGHIMQAETTGYVSSVSAEKIIVESLSKSSQVATVDKNVNHFIDSGSSMVSYKQNTPQVSIGNFYQLNGNRKQGISKTLVKGKKISDHQKRSPDRTTLKSGSQHHLSPPLHLEVEANNKVAAALGRKRGWTTVSQNLSQTFHFTPFSHSIPNFQRSNQDTCLIQRCVVKEGDWVQRGDILTDCSASNYGELSVGKNILVAYIPWEGYNFEDAIVISERLVQEHVYTSLHVERYDFEAQDFKGGNEWFTNILPGIALKNVKHLDEFGLPRIGSFVQEGDILVGKISCSDKKPTTPYERLLSDILEERSFAARDASLYVPRGVQGRVINSRIIQSFDNHLENKKFKGGLPKVVHVFLAEKRRIQLGDKMSGRHGNKGIVSNILPTQDMPYLPDGTPVDMILNPLGVPSRMNVGQVFECLLGLASNYLAQQFKITCFDEIYGPEASQSLVYLKLYQARLQSGQSWLFQVEFPGKTRLIDGRTGECFDQWITVGKAYMLKLIHMVNDKIHARATGPYALITQQPLRGRSQQGGQRLGEMEVWALEGFGAAYILQELLTKKSDDVVGRKEVAASILPRPTSILDMLQPPENLSKNHFVLGNPEIFKVLICELQSLCLDVGIYSLTNQSFQREFIADVY